MAFFAALPALGAVGGASGLMTGLSAAMGMVGTVMSAMGTIAAGKAQAQQAEVQAQNARFQAKQLRARGKFARAKQGREGDIAARKKRALLSRHRAVAAASGFMADDHTSSIQIANLERFGSFDEAMKRTSAAEWDNKNLANAQDYNAKAYMMEAQSAKSSAQMGAMATLVGGAGNLFSSFSGGGGSSGRATTAGWKATVKPGGGTPASSMYPYSNAFG